MSFAYAIAGFAFLFFLIVAPLLLIVWGAGLWAKDRDKQEDEYPYERRKDER